ncbi:MAG TPA: SRPBCC family protein [Candidatus Thermoplasmatota archaeon]
MGRHEIRVEMRVSAPARTIYDILADSGKTVRWLPNVTDVKVTNAKKGIGATRTVSMRMGNTDLMSNQRVVVAEPGKRFAWVHDLDFVDQERFDLLTDVGTIFELEPDGKKATQLIATAHFEPKGLRARLAAPFFTHDVKKQMTSALENIKRLAEKPQTPP